MPSESKARRNLVWALGLFVFIVVSLRLYSTSAMDSLPSPFTIEIDGTPITKVGEGAQDSTHAKTGAEAAVFELKDSLLHCDGWKLARSKTEDRSFLPKKVLWFKADSDLPVHPITATQDGESYHLKFANAGLMAADGEVFADLGGEHSANVVLRMRPQ